MLTGVEYVRSICAERKIPVSKLEKDCNFCNGYLNPKKLKKIPYDRAVTISRYLGVPLDLVLGTEIEKAPTGGERKSDVLDEVDVAFYGDYKQLTDDDKETVRDMVRIMRERRNRK